MEKMKYYHKRNSLAPYLVSKYYNKPTVSIIIKQIIKLFNTAPRILVQNILYEQSNHKLWTYSRSLYYLYLIICFFRANVLSVLNHNVAYLEVYMNYDVLFQLVWRLKVLDDLSSMMVISLLPIYAIYLDYICYAHSNVEVQNIFKLAYEIIVINRLHFIRLNFCIDQNPFLKLKEIIKTKNARLFYKCLKNFRTLPWFVRVELVLLSYLFDVILAIFQVFSTSLFTVGILYYLYKIVQFAGSVQSLIALVDMLFLCYGLFNTGKVALFFLYISNINSIGEYRRLNFFFTTILKTMKMSQNYRYSRCSLLQRQFLFYQHEHMSTYIRSVVINRCLVSRTLLATLLANVACSVIVIFILFYRTIGPMEKIAFLGVLAMQVIFTLIAALSAIFLCKTLYKLKSCVNQIQMSISDVIVKWKLLTFYELIESKKKFYFSVGPMGKLTQRSLLKVHILSISNNKPI